jgi:hypothetical protein
MQTNCMWPECAKRAREADIEFREWNHDSRAIYCPEHDDMIQDGKYPPRQSKAKQQRSRCQSVGCYTTAMGRCFFCHSWVCSLHTFRPMNHAPSVYACRGCNTDIRYTELRVPKS